jgi:hypothetical protein
VPATSGSTRLIIPISLVISPSTSSFAVAPASVYASPTVKEIDAGPFLVIIGAVVSGASETITVLVTSVASLPAASETL